MADIRPLLIFDTTALLAGKTPHWQEWARFGQCVIPQAVEDEIQFLSRQAPDPNQESIAREFLRYRSAGDFQVTAASALVGSTAPEGQSLSKRARLEQTIAECAYALAKHQVGTLVIVVSDARTVVRRIQDLGIPNLCAISLAELRTWIRQQDRPKAVEQAIQRMPGPPIPASPLKSGATPGTSSQSPPPLQPLPSTQTQTQTRKSKPKGSGFWRFIQRTWATITLLIALGLLAGSGLVAWRLLDPVGSQPLWDRLGLPDLREVPGIGEFLKPKHERN